MNVPLTDDEKAYFDEKFKNVEAKVDAALQYGARITKLEVEVAQRPTVYQLLGACGATATLATVITSLILQLF